MNPDIQLIIQYCNDPRPQRQAEYDECLRLNLACSAIGAVHNLIESKTNVPEEFTSHPKYAQHILDHWMTYKDALDHANQKLPGQTCCIANLDIFLDPAATWANAVESVKEGIVLCLSRTEWDTDGRMFLDPGLAQLAFANSQDAWIFKAPLELPDCDFEIGTLGCDNAIAERIKRAGLVPINAGSRFRIFHYDRYRGKAFANQAEVHKSEADRRPHPHPEKNGQYLLPDIDKARSVDQILDALKVPEVQRYTVICDVISRFVKINND